MKRGPIAAQYRFMADFNWYRGKGFAAADVFHDTFTFTLRKLTDFGHVHEGMVAFVPALRDELLAGVAVRYYAVAGTGLDSLTLDAVVFYRLRRKWLGTRFSPFGVVRLGTLLIDPMHRCDFAWIVALGLDTRLL